MGVKANNKELVREAADFYTKGLLEGCSDNKLNAVLLCNRAHAESLLGEPKSAALWHWHLGGWVVLKNTGWGGLVRAWC